jgi:hypothetical protein
MVVGFTTTCAIGAYQHLQAGYFSGYSVSSTNKTDMLLKVALNTLTSNPDCRYCISIQRYNHMFCMGVVLTWSYDTGNGIYMLFAYLKQICIYSMLVNATKISHFALICQRTWSPWALKN